MVINRGITAAQIFFTDLLHCSFPPDIRQENSSPGQRSAVSEYNTAARFAHLFLLFLCFDYVIENRSVSAFIILFFRRLFPVFLSSTNKKILKSILKTSCLLLFSSLSVSGCGEKSWYFTGVLIRVIMLLQLSCPDSILQSYITVY